MEKRLHKFSVLIETGSFTKAAQHLRVSQPALTTAIQKLERELKTELLIRGSHPLKATAAGNLALAAAEAQHTNLFNLQIQLTELLGQKPQLAIGMIDSAIEVLFTHGDSLKQLRETVNISLSINSSSQLQQAVEHDSLDVAFIVEQPQVPQYLTSTHVGSEPLVIVCRPDEELDVAASMQHGILPNFLSYNQSSTTEELIRQALHQNGIVPQPSFYSTSPAVMVKLALSQGGSAVLPYLLVREWLDRGELVLPLPSYAIERRISVIMRQGRAMPQAVRTLADHMQHTFTILMQASKL